VPDCVAVEKKKHKSSSFSFILLFVARKSQPGLKTKKTQQQKNNQNCLKETTFFPLAKQ
jgi:hypothetical protein